MKRTNPHNVSSLFPFHCRMEADKYEFWKLLEEEWIPKLFQYLSNNGTINLSIQDKTYTIIDNLSNTDSITHVKAEIDYHIGQKPWQLKVNKVCEIYEERWIDFEDVRYFGLTISSFNWSHDQILILAYDGDITVEVNGCLTSESYNALMVAIRTFEDRSIINFLP